MLHLLRWLREHTSYELEILVNGGGELLSEFQAIGRTTVWRSPSVVLDAFRRSAWTSQIDSQLLKLMLIRRTYDLVYFNTSAVASHVPALRKSAASMLWHIHELEYALRLTMGTQRIQELFPLATRFVVVSNSVRDALVRRFNVPADKVDLVHGSISIPSFTTQEAQVRRREIRDKLGWPQDAFVVGGCGAPGWRKGTDVFSPRRSIPTRYVGGSLMPPTDRVF